MAADTNPPPSEQAILCLEEQIPQVAQDATRLAHRRALAAGYVVLKVEGSRIVATQADGSSQEVGQTRPRRKVKVGEVLNVRRVAPHASA